MESRSAVVHEAVEALRRANLASEYRHAFSEPDASLDVWEASDSDGIDRDES
ncbi:MAG: hypothetical protein U0904_00825 [Candidatus Nanopelagicales bacterium]|nr:hypothetical protein [Candidatus Nanopelagicales bacterium]